METLREDIFFIHSKCCGAHWELTYDPQTGGYSLECEVCGKPVASGVEVIGPNLEGRTCVECEKEVP
jgi:hypothetical protein